MTAKGLALTIGLNSLDQKHYGGWSGDLNACENDAYDMADIAETQGFKTTTLLTKNATRTRVIEEIRNAAQTLKTGDIFMLSYSGHGGQLPDRNEDEIDAIDETWCLYDSQLVDDELFELFAEFEQGVRILVFSDSCHSGTVTKAAYYKAEMDVRTTNNDVNGTKYRFMPLDMVMHTYHLNKEFYNKILKREGLKDIENKTKASILLISGSQDNQYSADGIFNGLFTSQLLTVWKEGNFKDSYKEFHKQIVSRMPPNQTPNYYFIGPKVAIFEIQKPFTI